MPAFPHPESRLLRHPAITAVWAGAVVTALAGCASTGEPVAACSGNNFDEVTLRAGCSTICAQEPCRVFFAMPDGTGTLSVRESTRKLGDYAAGEEAFLGSFYTGLYVFAVESPGAPPAYLAVGSTSAN